MQPSYTKTSFLTFTGLQKSSQNRCQNAFKIGFILDTLLEPPKIRFLMLKRRQDGSPKFRIFFKIRLKILAMTVFGQRCLLEASKSLPRASQEPPQSPQEALHSLQEAQMQPPRGFRRGGLLDVHVIAFGTTHLKWNDYVRAVCASCPCLSIFNDSQEMACPCHYTLKC